MRLYQLHPDHAKRVEQALSRLCGYVAMNMVQYNYKSATQEEIIDDAIQKLEQLVAAVSWPSYTSTGKHHETR